MTATKIKQTELFSVINRDEVSFMAPARYPSEPGHQMRDTSLAAARRMREIDKGLREKALEVLRARGPMTADELAEAMGELPGSIRPRLSQLNTSGLVEATGSRRPNKQGNPMIVWRAKKG